MIKKLLDKGEKVIETIAMCFIVLMTLIIALQVGMRFFMNMTPKWSEEVALILMVWFGFIGIAIGVKRGIHISIEYFVSLFPKKLQYVVIKMNDLLIMAFGLMMMYFGSSLVKWTAKSTLPATQWPGYILYIMVPISGVVIAIFSFAKFAGFIEDDEVASFKIEIDDNK